MKSDEILAIWISKYAETCPKMGMDIVTIGEDTCSSYVIDVSGEESTLDCVRCILDWARKKAEENKDSDEMNDGAQQCAHQVVIYEPHRRTRLHPKYGETFSDAWFCEVCGMEFVMKPIDTAYVKKEEEK